MSYYFLLGVILRPVRSHTFRTALGQKLFQEHGLEIEGEENAKSNACNETMQPEFWATSKRRLLTAIQMDMLVRRR